MTYATLSLLRKASVILMWFTILSAVNTLPSEYKGWICKGLTYSLTATRNFSFTDVHVDGVERIAEAVSKYDVDRFIHVSSYNAHRDSPSEFFASKVGPWYEATHMSTVH